MIIFLQGSTYPLELLGDAKRLANLAAQFLCQDGREITTPEERTFARSAIFTAFNFLESLLIDLAQGCLASGAVSESIKAEIESDLKNGKASISKTIKEWPEKLGKSPIHGCAAFCEFSKLRRLRNKLTHPKLHPLSAADVTQDELLQEANAANAAWAVTESKKIGRLLCNSFGVRVSPELQ